jgi:GNAT superfamily N-acetyltransferase
LSHAFALYAHNREALDSFFWNGFGLRCVDAIRGVEPVISQPHPGYAFRELPIEEAVSRIVPLKNLLLEHLRSTPAFIPLYFAVDAEQMKEENQERQSRYFVADHDGRTIAFIEITASGENFACDDPSMMNICGAYMLPEYRGSGIYTKLLSYLIETLAKEGYTRCGVDFESFNPTASGFWMKYFTPYTYSVTRRIDERIYQPNK